MQEHDLEFKTTTIIKGQVLCKLIAEGHTNEYCDWENEVELNMIDVCSIFTAPNLGTGI